MVVSRFVVLVAATVACGRSSPTEELSLSRTCGGTEPILLLSSPREGPVGMVATPVGSRIVVDGATSGEDGEHWASCARSEHMVSGLEKMEAGRMVEEANSLDVGREALLATTAEKQPGRLR